MRALLYCLILLFNICNATEYFSWSTPTQNILWSEGRADQATAVVGDLIYVYGGNDNVYYYNDMHTFNTTNETWSLLETSGDQPIPTCAPIFLNFEPNKFLLIGGFGTPDGSNYLNDDNTYVFDLETNVWTRMPTTGDYEGRAWGCYAVDDDLVYSIFGWIDLHKDDTNTILRLNTTSWNWENVTYYGDTVSKRDGMTCQQIGRKVYIYGGTYYEDLVAKAVYSDLYIFDLDTFFLRLVTFDNDQTARSYAGSTIYHDKIMIVGGLYYDITSELIALADITLFDPETEKWLDLVVKGRFPARGDFSVNLINDNQIYFLGGKKADARYVGDYYMLSKACQEGYAGTSACQICPMGSYALGIGNRNCTLCDAGFHSNVSGSAGCTQCIQSYSAIGSGICSECPEHSNTVQLGTDITSCVCNPGFFGENGKKCSACPHGGDCDAFGTVIPIVTAGYWRHMNSDGTVAFAECAPTEACTGGAQNTCVEGYAGFRCASCTSGFYFVGGRCTKCKPGATGLFVVYILLPLLAIVILSFMMRRSQTNVPTILIMLEFIQVLSILSNLSHAVPAALGAFLRIIAVADFNFDAFSPSCAVTFNYWGQLSFVLSIPLILAVYVAVVHLIAYLANKFPAKFKKNFRFEPNFLNYFRNIQLNVALLLGSILYVYLCSKTIEPLVCAKQVDGKFYVVANPSVVCYDKQWLAHFPMILVSILGYLIAFPIYCAWAVYWSKKHHTPDETLQRYSSMFSVYKPNRWWWGISVVRLRRISLVLIQLASDRTVAVAISQLFAAAALFAQITGKPYITKTANWMETAMIACWMVFLYSLVSAIDLFIIVIIIREWTWAWS